VTTGDAYDAFSPIEFHDWAPPVPFVRNYFKNERLYARLAAFLRRVVRERSIEVMHAQHLMTGPAAIAAGRGEDIPVLCTIRDYWPVCYWSDLILDPNQSSLCPGCSASRMTRCVRPHAGGAWPLALPAIPYMRANLRLKQRQLARADAVIAVSAAIARDLRQRAPELGATRLEIVHNPVDVGALRRHAAGTAPPMPGPYAVFVGKLEINKGVGGLLRAVSRGRLPWPLVVIGDGTERTRLEAAARAAALDVRFTGWLDRQGAVAWLRHARLLVYPSYGPESLSRVLIEASALGVPIAAMETGGTADIIEHEHTGLLAQSFDGLGDAVARLVSDPVMAAKLGSAAAQRAQERFAAEHVVAQVEQLYADLIAERSSRRA
jgi:glycosyltransferase involved in cell wall biosynthesis